MKPAFDLDFTALKLGRPHHMLFGSTKVGPDSHHGRVTEAELVNRDGWYADSQTESTRILFGAGCDPPRPATLPATAHHDYDPPVPGSYTCRAVKRAPDGALLDRRAKLSLRELAARPRHGLEFHLHALRRAPKLVLIATGVLE